MTTDKQRFKVMKNWYSIKNRTSDVLDISIHDEIGLWGVSAKDFISNLREHENISAINLSIHSPGGNVLDGFAMYNALKHHPAKVYGKVEGVAASAASYILMASDVIEMPEDAFIMIHNAHAGVMGDADDMRDMADVVDKLQDSIVNIYVNRSGQSAEQIREMMKAETWMNAADALEYGFIDTITDAVGVAAKINIFNRYFKTMPVENENKIETVETIRDYEKYLRESGLSKGLAQALTNRAKLVFKREPEKPDNALNKAVEKLGNFNIREFKSMQN